MNIIVYGCGSYFDPDKFKPVVNRDNKPKRGGLWGSPVGSEYGWKEWCESEEFGDLTSSFKLEITGNIFTIDCVQDMLNMPTAKSEYDWMYCIDFQHMVRCDIQAIHLTIDGQNATRFTDPGMYGWDCESVLILDKGCII